MISRMPGLSTAPIQMLRGEEALQGLSLYRAGVESSGEQADGEQAKLKEAARGFDAYFARTLLKEMRNSVMKSSLFGSGAAAEIYQDLFDDHLAEALSAAGGFGLGAMIERDYSAALGRVSARQAVAAYEKQSESRPRLPLEAATQPRPFGSGAENKTSAYSLERNNSNGIKRLDNLEGEAEK